ncbi:hypothetical protein BC826DRAFT_983885 [Russula brevipes]|nr:hypothetical protein BC826DRAFT_983885 [Russula brevipes]
MPRDRARGQMPQPFPTPTEQDPTLRTSRSSADAYGPGSLYVAAGTGIPSPYSLSHVASHGNRLRDPTPNPGPFTSSPLSWGGAVPPNPVPQNQPLQQPGPPISAPGSQIQPGAVTYTTSTSPDGKLTYHPFSYQTATGVVSGIQWIPAEATSVIPAGAQPANSDFVSPWNRGNRDNKALREWQKDEEHRIRKEEKEAAKRIKKEKERQARERDARAMSVGPYGAYTNPMNDLERRMDGVDLGRGRNPVSEYNRSPYQPPMAPPSPKIGAGAGYPPGYPNPSYPPPGHGVIPILSRSRDPSPNPMGAAASAVYSPAPVYGNRSRAPSPIPGSVPAAAYPPQHPRSRAPSPLPGAPPPYSGQPGGFQYPTGDLRTSVVAYRFLLPDPRTMLPPPDGFSRPANLAQMPKMLVPHDCYHEDWIRFIQDLAVAWAGKLPTADASRSSRSSVVTAELIDLWNSSFFTPRGVEVVLFKGHERRSGPYAGQVERNLPGFGDDSDSDSDSSSLSSDSSSLSSDSSSRSDDKYGRGGGGGAGGGYYGGGYPDSKRRKAEHKAEKKRKAKEKKARRRARERERTYALYITCVAPRDGALGAPY